MGNGGDDLHRRPPSAPVITSSRRISRTSGSTLWSKADMKHETTLGLDTRAPRSAEGPSLSPIVPLLGSHTAYETTTRRRPMLLPVGGPCLWAGRAFH
jgi:hypothetical protein